MKRGGIQEAGEGQTVRCAAQSAEERRIDKTNVQADRDQYRRDTQVCRWLTGSPKNTPLRTVPYRRTLYDVSGQAVRRSGVQG